ncbi:orotate phosphoribosyltransferase [bacterium]|nr:orotate phosphoribosyltransferase [bacterium]
MIINEIIDNLIKCNCIQKGLFKLKNGDTSRYYFNMKNLISYPKLLKIIGDELYKKLPEFDIICGIPYGGLPIASYISTTYNKPMIIIRDKKKEYGMENLIEGEYKDTDKCIIIDDVITTGGSIKEIYELLKDKVQIVNTVVIMDRQQHDFEKDNYTYLLCKNDIIKYYLKKISTEKNSKICFSADITDPYKLINILSEIGEYIVICKLHYDIIDDDKYDGNLINDIIELSIKHNFLLMEDRKFVDISYIVDKQYKRYKNWVDLVTVHGSCNPDVLKKLSGALLVSNMSNNTFNYDNKCINMYKMHNDRVVGFITQYRIELDDLVCMTPGISITDNKIDDQNYRGINMVDTDIYIIGRAIYNSNNYVESVKNFLN